MSALPLLPGETCEEEPLLHSFEMTTTKPVLNKKSSSLQRIPSQRLSLKQSIFETEVGSTQRHAFLNELAKLASGVAKLWTSDTCYQLSRSILQANATSLSSSSSGDTSSSSSSSTTTADMNPNASKAYRHPLSTLLSHLDALVSGKLSKRMGFLSIQGRFIRATTSTSTSTTVSRRSTNTTTITNAPTFTLLNDDLTEGDMFGYRELLYQNMIKRIRVLILGLVVLLGVAWPLVMSPQAHASNAFYLVDWFLTALGTWLGGAKRGDDPFISVIMLLFVSFIALWIWYLIVMVKKQSSAASLGLPATSVPSVLRLLLRIRAPLVMVSYTWSSPEAVVAARSLAFAVPDVWVDVCRLSSGSVVSSVTSSTVNNAGVMVIILTKEYLTSRACGTELIAAALTRQSSNQLTLVLSMKPVSSTSTTTTTTPSADTTSAAGAAAVPNETNNTPEDQVLSQFEQVEALLTNAGFLVFHSGEALLHYMKFHVYETHSADDVYRMIRFIRRFSEPEQKLQRHLRLPSPAVLRQQSRFPSFWGAIFGRSWCCRLNKMKPTSTSYIHASVPEGAIHAGSAFLSSDASSIGKWSGIDGEHLFVLFLFLHFVAIGSMVALQCVVSPDHEETCTPVYIVGVVLMLSVVGVPVIRMTSSIYVDLDVRNQHDPVLLPFNAAAFITFVLKVLHGQQQKQKNKEGIIAAARGAKKILTSSPSSSSGSISMSNPLSRGGASVTGGNHLDQTLVEMPEEEEAEEERGRGGMENEEPGLGNEVEGIFTSSASDIYGIDESGDNDDILDSTNTEQEPSSSSTTQPSSSSSSSASSSQSLSGIDMSVTRTPSNGAGASEPLFARTVTGTNMMMNRTHIPITVPKNASTSTPLLASTNTRNTSSSKLMTRTTPTSAAVTSTTVTTNKSKILSSTVDLRIVFAINTYSREVALTREAIGVKSSPFFIPDLPHRISNIALFLRETVGLPCVVEDLKVFANPTQSGKLFSGILQHLQENTATLIVYVIEDAYTASEWMDYVSHTCVPTNTLILTYLDLLGTGVGSQVGTERPSHAGSGGGGSGSVNQAKFLGDFMCVLLGNKRGVDEQSPYHGLANAVLDSIGTKIGSTIRG